MAATGGVLHIVWAASCSTYGHLGLLHVVAPQKDPEMVEFAREEITVLQERLSTLEKEVQLMLLPK